MASWLIVDKETRVWRNRTSDPQVVASLDARHAAVEVPDDFSPPIPPVGKEGLGWWRVNDKGEFAEATPEERDAAYTKVPRAEQQAVLDACSRLSATCEEMARSDAKLAPLLDDIRTLSAALIGHFKPKPAYNN